MIVLCPDDEVARTGHTMYRLVGELLLSTRIVLIGPNIVQTWPGARGLVTPGRMRELAALCATAWVSLATTLAAFALIVLQDVLVRMRLVR